MLTIDDQATAGTDVIVVDEAPAGTMTPAGPSTQADGFTGAGIVGFSGPVGAFAFTSATAVSKPVIGDRIKARILLNAVVLGQGTLTITASDTNYTLPTQPGPQVLTSNIGGTSGGQVTFINLVDLANNVLATDPTVPTVRTTGLQGPFGPVAFEGSRNVGFRTPTISPFSLTDRVTVIHTNPNQITTLGAESQVMDKRERSEPI